jgi:hypothetical protein
MLRAAGRDELGEPYIMTKRSKQIMSYRRILLPLTLAALAAACGKDSPTGPNTDQPDPSKATVKLVNNSANSVLFARTRACGATAWGSDLLGSSNILWSHQTLNRPHAAGCFDLRLTPGEAGADYLYFTDLQLEAGNVTTITITAFPAE